MKEIRNTVYPYKKFEIKINYKVPDSPSDVTFLFIQDKKQQGIAEFLAEYLPKEKVNFVSVSHPFIDKAALPGSKKRRRKILQELWKDVKKTLPKSKFLFIGGISSGAAIAAEFSPEFVNGYAFLSWRLHSPRIRIPYSRKALFSLQKDMIFISGTEDKYSDRGKLELMIGALHPYARLMLVPECGHSLELPSETKRSQEELMREIGEVLLWFMSDVIDKEIKKK